MAPMIDDIIYVAVSNNVKESKPTLLWTLQNSGGKKVCIIHVHQPAQMIPLMGTKFPASSMKEQEVRAYRELEKQNMQKILNEYLLICRQMGARAEKLHAEKDCIEKGIVELISRYGIRKLVMGAAADKHCSSCRKTMDLKSKKAIYVRQQAPLSCHIQFVCKGHVIHTREASLHRADAEVTSLLQVSPDIENGQSNHLPLRSPTTRHDLRVELTNPAQDLLRRVRSVKIEKFGGSRTDVSSPVISEGFSITSTSERNAISRRSSPWGFGHSACFSSDISLVAYGETGESGNGLELYALPQSKEDLHPSSPPSVLDGSIDDTLQNHLDKVMAEARNARQEAFQETVNRGKAEKNAFDAIHKAKASESLYVEELKQRKEIEESLVKEKEQLGKMKNQHGKVMEELQFAIGQKSSLEMQVAASEQMVKELEQKIISAVELLQNYEKERDELQTDRDNALKQAEELRKKRGEASSESMPQFFSEFSFSEIEEATRNFDACLKIGEGGYGTIHKGALRHTEVAIKMPHSHSLQGPLEFHQEVDVLSKLRHPNLVTLIGACQEAWALIYEYLPNGSLEDRLSCEDVNSLPLSWQIRVRIAAELCSALIFLHSCEPNSIIHGDLKPANILLDANLVTKLSDFGICRLFSRDQSSNNLTQLWRTEPKGTFVYMDPEFLSTGELTSKSDVYSFGIILLQLLTGRLAMGIAKEVQYALDTGKLNALLDPLAGDWPFVQAEQLARLALRCCDINRESRPDLESEVWRVLEPMRISCGGPSSFQIGSEERCSPPTYFICPIFREVMQDPHVAADGFTYEAEALRGWLDSGRDTSPMTNLKLEHCNLVPNHVLRSAIQEWLQQQ
ncbi:U-box domain-containing protein 33-like [Juglans microcarpa x Juglans regia]|uniref:U-box domain-containing protein 33-like n=1 Tax=Juglans microcarpa x Juglans regia TaxID=2249226 RepID=UPI001B7E33D8|nr:U-box domain-containing protein 33-like [Juglans microcarpa x Juglans regia]